jgi:hypothetical protein
MNHSFYSADRTTHSKVVVIALICATTVAGIGIAAHSRGVDNPGEAAHPGAGRPAVMASAVQVALR